MPSGTRPPRVAPGTARSERRLGRRLPLACAALLLLPLAAGASGATDRKSVSGPLARLAASSNAFGNHYRGYPERQEALQRLLARTGTPDDRAALQRFSAAAGTALDAMRRQVGELSATGLSDRGPALAVAWRDVEDRADAALRSRTRRIAAGQRQATADDASGADAAKTALQQRDAAAYAALREAAALSPERVNAMDEADDARVADSLRAAGSSLGNSNRLLLGLAGLATLAMLVVAFALVRRKPCRRLDRLLSAARRLSGGELDRPVPVDGEDELGELAAALEAYRLSALSLARSERRLAERSRALGSLQRDFDQFASAASQQLVPPLRAINSLAGFLREDLGAELRGEPLRHLDLLQARARRVETRLDSLLKYTRAGRGTQPDESVELRELVEHCIDLVSPPGAQVVLNGGFGRVSTRREPLEQIVSELLDNAFRHNDDAHGLVSLDCDLAGSEVRIVVADCGPGIAPESHDRLFGLFQPLAPGERAAGGTGLAVLHRLIDSHGGSIAVDSDPARQRGTAFIVCWPVNAVLSARNDAPDGHDVLTAVAGAA